MEKMKELTYLEKRIQQNSDFKGQIEITGLERGFGTTLGVSLRRVLLSNIGSIAPFCVRIEGAEHEFQVIKDVKEDVVSIISNLKKVSFKFDPQHVSEDQFIKVTINPEAGTTITSKDLIADDFSIDVIDKDIYIAEVSKPGALKLELYLRYGRVDMTFEENKSFVNEVMSSLDTSLKSGSFIAVDSIFSPIKKVKPEIQEMNSASVKIEEKLTLEVETNGSVTADDAIKEACRILIAHYQFILGSVGNVVEEVFAKPTQETEKDIEDIRIDQLGLTVRSTNALMKDGILTLNQLCKKSRTELENVKNLGKKSFDEIVQKISDLGLNLNEKGDDNGES